MTIGRGDRCEIQIEQDSVSRKHARIEQRGERFLIRDLGSMNGTFIDDRPVRESVLAEGALVKVGETIFRFSRRTPAEGVPASDPSGEGSPPAAPAFATQGS
jgi:pSer/pThr/pTyr-binding forkhead associated (FHA) protein